MTRSVKHDGVPNSVSSGATGISKSPRFTPSWWVASGFPRLRGQNLVLALTRTLAKHMKLGTPLLAGLKQSASREPNFRMRKLEGELSRAIEEGFTFSEAIACHPEVFDPFYVTMVKAGELSGALETTLDQLASTLHREQRMRRRLQGAAVYPLAVIAGALLLAVLLALTAWPPLQMWIQDGLTRHLSLLVGCVAVLVFGLWMFVHTRRGRRWMDRGKLRFPVTGRLTTKLVTARCLRTMGLLLSINAPILQALHVSATRAGNTVVREAWEGCREAVKEGMSFLDLLEGCGFCLGPMPGYAPMIDEPNSLENQLLGLANNLDQEVEDGLDWIAIVASPVLVVLLIVLTASLVFVLLRLGL